MSYPQGSVLWGILGAPRRLNEAARDPREWEDLCPRGLLLEGTVGDRRGQCPAPGRTDNWRSGDPGEVTVQSPLEVFQGRRLQHCWRELIPQAGHPMCWVGD